MGPAHYQASAVAASLLVLALHPQSVANRKSFNQGFNAPLQEVGRPIVRGWKAPTEGSPLAFLYIHLLGPIESLSERKGQGEWIKNTVCRLSQPVWVNQRATCHPRRTFAVLAVKLSISLSHANWVTLRSWDNSGQYHGHEIMTCSYEMNIGNSRRRLGCENDGRGGRKNFRSHTGILSGGWMQEVSDRKIQSCRV